VSDQPEKRSVAVIGLDGATIDLIKQWAGEGKLPAMARLMEEGAFGHLETIPNQNSAPAWTSFMTGKNPGKHGIYHFYEREENGYGIRYVNGGDCKAEPIWTLLSNANKKVCVSNVPMTYPAPEVDGILISGMDAPGVVSEGFTYPREFVNELLENVPDYVVEPGITTFFNNKQYDKAIEMASDSIVARGEAARYLQHNYPWDFFMVVFRESDVISHYFWKPMEDGPNGEDKLLSEYHDTILKIYQKLDDEIAKIVADLPEDCYVVLMSDHGFGLAEDGPPYVNHVLRHAGLLEYRGQGADSNQARPSLKRMIMGTALGLVQQYTSRRTKEALLRLFPKVRDRLEAQKYFSAIDWERTKVYGEGTRIELWVNMKGRDPLGTVAPGADYDELCAGLKKLLYQWHEPTSGKPVIKAVFTKEEVYSGACAERAPDILFHFHDDVKVTGIDLIDEDGNKQSVSVPDNVMDILHVNGAHRDTGTFMIKGPGIKAGQEITGASIMDLTPTILYIMQQAVPDDMDGKVLLDAFEDDFKRANSVTTREASDFKGGSSSGGKNYDADEEKQIEERLKGLGYL